MDWNAFVRTIAIIFAPLMNVGNTIIQAVAPGTTIATTFQDFTDSVNAAAGWTPPPSSGGQSQVSAPPGAAGTSPAGQPAAPAAPQLTPEQKRQLELERMAQKLDRADQSLSGRDGRRDFAGTAAPPFAFSFQYDETVNTDRLQPSSSVSLQRVQTLLGLDTIDDSIEAVVQALRDTLNTARQAGETAPDYRHPVRFITAILEPHDWHWVGISATNTPLQDLKVRRDLKRSASGISGTYALSSGTSTPRIAPNRGGPPSIGPGRGDGGDMQQGGKEWWEKPDVIWVMYTPQSDPRNPQDKESPAKIAALMGINSDS